jgi:hypothetical protein
MLNLKLADVDPTYAAQHPDCALQVNRVLGTPTGTWEALIIDRQNYVLGYAAGRDEVGAARAAVADAEANGNRRRADSSVKTKCSRGHENTIPRRQADSGRVITFRCTFAGCTDTFPVGNRAE